MLDYILFSYSVEIVIKESCFINRVIRNRSAVEYNACQTHSMKGFSYKKEPNSVSN